MEESTEEHLEKLLKEVDVVMRSDELHLNKLLTVRLALTEIANKARELEKERILKELPEEKKTFQEQIETDFNDCLSQVKSIITNNE